MLSGRFKKVFCRKQYHRKTIGSMHELGGNLKYLADGTVIYQLWENTAVGEQKVNNTTGAAVYKLEYLYDSVGNILPMIYNGV